MLLKKYNEKVAKFYQPGKKKALEDKIINLLNDKELLFTFPPEITQI
jgi:hypothetical protein